MKRTKKIIISIIISVVIIAGGIFTYYKFFYDQNKLSLTEKEWIDDQKNAVITFNIPGNINTFSVSGNGVFYDFLNGFEKEHELSLNKNVVNNKNELGFVINDKIDKEDLLLFKDHFVIVSKKHKEVRNISGLSGQNVGVLSGTTKRMENYNLNSNFSEYNNKNDLLTAIKDDKVEYIIVPLNEYIDVILENDYKIIYHLDDTVNYYYIHLGDDDTLNSIIKKYYNNWIKTKFEKSYYTNLNALFIDKLKITQIELDRLNSKTYTYGFINNIPYNTLSSSRYGGKVIAYLEEFSKFSNVEFTFTKFNQNNELYKAFNKKKVDLLFDIEPLENQGINIATNMNNKFYIISPLSDSFKVINLNDIQNNEIYVIKNSKIEKELKEYNNITLKTVKNERDLIGLTKHHKIIAISVDAYEFLKNNKIKNYQVVFSGYASNYNFKYQNNNDTFYKLFSNYVLFISDYNMNNNGILSYAKAESSGNMISLIAKYILITIAISILVVGLIIASKKHIKLNTKIKKDEKLKFVDMLTSLKNRNYLNERINTWNQNTIYPQAIIVVDLNNIKYLNDTFGHEEGDKQIMAAANILHQSQLDNTEIMRTDGNEFMVYLVGYNEKQVVNYLKKLVKEFKELPYEYGAAFGFSMIVDDLKLIDDAINEATIQMRKNKEENETKD